MVTKLGGDFIKINTKDGTKKTAELISKFKIPNLVFRYKLEFGFCANSKERLKPLNAMQGICKFFLKKFAFRIGFFIQIHTLSKKFIIFILKSSKTVFW